MTTDLVSSNLQSALDRILETKRRAAIPLAPGTELLGGNLPIDSLDLAQLVLEMQSITGKDPFESGFLEFRTAAELVQLFAD